MKRLMKLTMMICLLGISITTRAGVSINEIRENARFITDRMRYELHLSYYQYNDAYEVNFDFVNNAIHLMPFVTRGEDWAINDYYRLLDIRNEDLRWILTSRQYVEFMEADYFFRPIYTSGGQWYFRIYLHYKDRHFFHFALPKLYHSYNGAHHRKHFSHESFYRKHFHERYSHTIYEKHHSMFHDKNYRKISQRDFGHKPSKDATRRPKDATRPNKQQPPTFHVGNGKTNQPTARPRQEQQGNKPQNEKGRKEDIRKDYNNPPKNNNQTNRSTRTQVERREDNSNRNSNSTRSGRRSNERSTSRSSGSRR